MAEGQWVLAGAEDLGSRWIRGGSGETLEHTAQQHCCLKWRKVGEDPGEKWNFQDGQHFQSTHLLETEKIANSNRNK